MYAAQTDERPLTFDTVGVWRRNLILRDRETGSLWQQATGLCIYGRLKGAQLSLLGGSLATWEAWQAEQPKTLAAGVPPNAPGGMLSDERMAALPAITRRLVLPGMQACHGEIDPHEEVVGLALGGETRAYPLQLLAKLRVVNDEVSDLPVTIVYHPESNLVRAFVRPLDSGSLRLAEDGSGLVAGVHHWTFNGRPAGERQRPLHPLSIERSWWLGWNEFHPETILFKEKP